MQQINNLSNDADQLVSFTLDDGSSLSLEFIYRPGIQRWAVSITHASLPGGVVNGFNICQGPNILRQYKNVIPFGMCVISSNGLDPMNATDFQDGTVAVYILSADEVQQCEDTVMSPEPLENA